MIEKTPIVSLDLVNSLICPVSGVKLELDQSENKLVNKQFGISYRIIDGIPIMTPEERVLSV
ncbi:MAG: Trm112 family protein [Alphaproteobacteria bacterium]|nr:Trm112 family protein [Alphaproteobacteria bacterium]